jgi:hypothetical protein
MNNYDELLVFFSQKCLHQQSNICDQLTAVEGVEVGRVDGAAVGLFVGVVEGVEVGTVDGAAVGLFVGVVEGVEVGTVDGAAVGLFVGVVVGCRELVG